MSPTSTEIYSRPSRRKGALAIGFLFAIVLVFVGLLLAAANRADAAGACGGSGCDTVAFVDGASRVSLYGHLGADAAIKRFYFGDPKDDALMGDWNCDGESTPGTYSRATGFASLRNENSQGAADRQFYFGIPGDVPIVGDFNGNACDTVSIYRPSEQRFYITNQLGGGVAAYSFVFGDPGDSPFAGDFDGNGVDTVGVHRGTSGRIHLSNAKAPRSADLAFVFGNPGDQIIAGDWDGNGTETVGAYRRSNGVLYLKNTNGSGDADVSLSVGRFVTVNPASGIADIALTPDVEWSVDVEVYAGESLGALAQSYGEGTVFRVHGTLDGQEVRPKSGQVFVGAPGAVLDGGGRAAYAFRSGAENVVIEGLEITGYESGSQDGAIQASGSGWVIRGNEIHHNATVGVKIYRADGAMIEGNNIHHNGQLGISVAYSSGTGVEGNEIAFNNWQEDFSWGWEAGGTKFWTTDGLVVRDNWSHDNHGPGLWSDHDNIRILYEDNLVEDNYANGIFHEISYGAVIRDNTIRRNGFGHDAWLWGGGIVMSSSSGADVYGNVLTGNYNGITMVQQDRGSGAYGAYVVKNNRIHDNTIINSGISGAAQDIGSSAIFNANNTFVGNDYRGTSRWEWENRRRTWDTWRSYGHDNTGTYTP